MVRRKLSNPIRVCPSKLSLLRSPGYINNVASMPFFNEIEQKTNTAIIEQGQHQPPPAHVHVCQHVIATGTVNVFTSSNVRMVGDKSGYSTNNSTLIGIEDLSTSSNNSSVDVVTIGDDEPISMVINNNLNNASLMVQEREMTADNSINKAKILCGVCGMAFRFPSKLRRHEKIHQPESEFPKEFPCDVCSKAFRYAYHLRRHKWLIHAPDRPVFTCDVCFKSYKGEELFRLHSAMAHLPGSSSSSIAGPSSSTAALLAEKLEPIIDVVTTDDCSSNFDVEKPLMEETPAVEMVTASNNNKQQQQQMFNCHVCGTNFKQKHYLTQHLMTHSKERPFVCEVCHKGFARASTLFAHRYVHTVGRQFQCETCKKAFKHKRSLTEHIKSKICFLGERQPAINRSSTCSSAASPDDSNNSIGQSINSQTGRQQQQQQQQQNGGQFVCEFCGAFFASVSYLFMHRRRCHRENLRQKQIISTTETTTPPVPTNNTPQPAGINNNSPIRVSVVKTVGIPQNTSEVRIPEEVRL